MLEGAGGDPPLRAAAALDVAPQVPGIGRELACDHGLERPLQHTRGTVQLARRHEVHPRPVALGLEGPGPIDRVRALDDVRAEAAWPVELGELDDLLDLPAARLLHALADPRPLAEGAVG